MKIQSEKRDGKKAVYEWCVRNAGVGGDEDDTILDEFVIDNYMVNDVDGGYNMEDSNRDYVMKNASGGSEIGGDRATDSDEYEHDMERNEDTQTRGKKGKKKQWE